MEIKSLINLGLLIIGIVFIFQLLKPKNKENFSNLKNNVTCNCNNDLNEHFTLSKDDILGNGKAACSRDNICNKECMEFCNNIAYALWPNCKKVRKKCNKKK